MQIPRERFEGHGRQAFGETAEADLAVLPLVWNDSAPSLSTAIVVGWRILSSVRSARF
jgi:hypothetical protein